MTQMIQTHSKTAPTIALFDLDHTLLPGDSDHGWGQFLARKGYVDPAYHKERSDYFYGRYTAGTLDIHEFCAFSLNVLVVNDIETVKQWRSEYMQECIAPLMRPHALELVQNHQRAGHIVALTTATNDFVTAPIAQMLGIDHLIATRAEQIDGKYTGRIAGEPNFQAGKVIRAAQWLESQGLSWDTVAMSFAYSDSFNDAPLLAQATFAIATNPDAKLKQMALEKRWSVLELFGDEDLR